MTTVFVVMSNDYPDVVFKNKDDAETYCKNKNEEDKKQQRGQRIYYRWYDMLVRESL